MAEDYFIIEHEEHIGPTNEAKEYRHYRDYQRFVNSVEGVMRIILADPNLAEMAVETHMGPEAAQKEKEPEPEDSIAKMDEAGIDMARLLGIEPIKKTK